MIFLTKQKTIGTHRGWFAHDIGQGYIYIYTCLKQHVICLGENIILNTSV